jgi:hypothetical protein
MRLFIAGLWVLSFGPLSWPWTVTGRHLYEEVKAEAVKRIPENYRRLEVLNVVSVPGDAAKASAAGDGGP